MNNLSRKIIHVAIILICGLSVFSKSGDGISAQEKNLRKFVGIWEVKETGVAFIMPIENYRTWVISLKKGKLVIEIPNRKLTFRDVEVSGRRLSAKISTVDGNGAPLNKSLDIVVRQDRFDGQLVDGSRVSVTGQPYLLYREAKDAEEVFIRKLADEKRRLGEGVKRLEEYRAEIEQQKQLISQLRGQVKTASSKVAGATKERNQDLAALKRQYQSKLKSSNTDFNKKIRDLREDLSTERKKAPRVNVSRMPRNVQAYRSLDLKKGPNRASRTYFKISAGQALIKLASVDNGWSLVATDKGDLGYVPTTQLRSVATSFAPRPTQQLGASNDKDAVEDGNSNTGVKIIQITQPRRGTGANKNLLLIPAPGFITFKGTLAGSKINSFKINNQRVNIGRGGSFRHLLELEEGQRIQMIATAIDGQERLDLRVRVTGN